ncbi:MAG: flavin reductase family protein [Halanaeroarchaeum sp.]
MIEYSADELEPDENARIVKSAVTPRPIAWISTVDEDGNENLAPFSSYTYVDSHDPVVEFNSPNEGSGRMKDTAMNVLATEEFAVNVVTEDVIETMDMTSASLDADESEFAFADVDRDQSTEIAAPRVADAAITMECTLYDAIDVHDRVMILGDVVHYHVSEDVLTDGKVDSRKLPTVGRLGGPYYTVSDPIEFERQF